MPVKLSWKYQNLNQSKERQVKANAYIVAGNVLFMAKTG